MIDLSTLSMPVPFNASWNVLDSTKIMSFMSCKKKFFMSFVLGWKQPSNHLVFGQAVHAAMEVLYMQGYTVEAVKDGLAAFLEVYGATYPEEEWDEYWPKTPHRFMQMLMMYVKQYQHVDKSYRPEEINGKKLIEISGTALISERHTIAFRMDTIMRNQNNKVFSLEHKTASSMYGLQTQFEFSFQVFMYYFVLYMLFEPTEIDGIHINVLGFKKTKAGGPAEKKDGMESHFFFERLRFAKTEKDLNFFINFANNICDEIEREFKFCAEFDNAENTFMQSFPCNMTACTMYGGCEYKALCMYIPNIIKEAGYGIPYGFTQEYWNPLEIEAKVNLSLSQEGVIDVQ